MGLVVGIALVWFIIEMLLWYLIAQSISGWWVFFWFIVAAFIGASMIKKTAQTLNPMAQQMRSGIIPNPANQPSENSIVKSVAMGLAGILLILPGLMSDVVAGLLLLPVIQKKLTTTAKDYALKNQDKMMAMMAMMAKQMGGNSPFGNMAGMGGSPFGQSPFGNANFGGRTTVDGEAKPINPSQKNITSANDD